MNHIFRQTVYDKGILSNGKYTERINLPSFGYACACTKGFEI